jgi:hypothetical protein
LLQLLVERARAALERQRQLRPFDNWLWIMSHNWTLTPSQLPGNLPV